MDLEAERARQRKGRAIAIVLAMALHVAFVLSIPEVRDVIGIEMISDAELVEEVKPPEPEPETPPPPAPIDPPRVRQPRETPAAPQPNEPPPVNEPPPPAPPPLDLTGMTIEGSSSPDAIPAAPAGAVANGTRGGTAGGTPGGVVGGTVGGTGTTLTAANLSRDPRPPGGLNDAALRRNYPLGARRTGTPGTATVRITVGPDGRVRAVSVGRETPAEFGFGTACKATVLEAGNWQPALDQNGNPGTFTFPFRCTFDINQ